MDSFLSNSLSIFFYNQITCVSNYLSQSEAVVKSVISKTSPSCKIDKAMKENKRDKNDKTTCNLILVAYYDLSMQFYL